MGMAALGIGVGDEVIMADTNWIATAAPIVHLGAKPIFVDILPDSWCIDPDLAEAAITPRTKAIVAVHLYGNLCDMNRLLAIGEKYDIPIIEDAAEAIGSVYHGKRAGSMDKFGSFSFHGTKTLTTGEGGMFVANDDSLYEISLLRCKNIERRLVVSALKNPFSWTFDMIFYGSISLESRKLVSHLNSLLFTSSLKCFLGKSFSINYICNKCCLMTIYNARIRLVAVGILAVMLKQQDNGKSKRR